MLSHDFIQTRLKYAGVKDKAPVIDVSRAGYCKVKVSSQNISTDILGAHLPFLVYFPTDIDIFLGAGQGRSSQAARHREGQVSGFTLEQFGI